MNHIIPSDFKSSAFNFRCITRIGEDCPSVDITKINEKTIIYLVKPEKEILNSVITIHLQLKSLQNIFQETIVFIPGETYEILEYMEFNNIIKDIAVESLNFDLIPIDNDLVSLERDCSIKDIFINQDITILNDLAYALIKLETCFGIIKHKYIKGDNAKAFCDILSEKEKEVNLKNENEILGMIVLDRSVDFMTTMTTNYTCEGLIDESIGINLGKIKIKESILKENLDKKASESTKLVTYYLTSKSNPLYCIFRCMHYLDALKYICSLREFYHNLLINKNKDKNMTTSQLRELTEDMNYFMKHVKNDLLMNEGIINFIIQPLQDKNYTKYIQNEQLMLAGDLPSNLNNLYEEHLSEQRELLSLIKLIVIESLTQGGLKDYQKLKREILNIYGYQNIFLFKDLESLGWLKEKQLFQNLKRNLTEITFSSAMEKLELINLNYNPMNITDCSYVLGGFCPLSLKLIQRAIEGKWNKIHDTIKKMPGYLSYPQDESEISNPQKDKNIILIVFIGGVTYTEIEGIRFLNRKYNEEYETKKRAKRTQFVIVTTDIINSKKLLSKLGKNVNSTFTMKQYYEQIKK